MKDFVKCDSCRAKPGTPALCGGCKSNRQAISILLKQRSWLVRRMKSLKWELDMLKSGRIIGYLDLR